MTTSYPLAIPFDVSVSNIAMFDRFIKDADKANEQFDQMRARVDTIMGAMVEHHHKDLAAEIKSLRTMIRQASFGGAKVQHAGDIDDDSLGETTLSEAELQLLNRIWRKLRSRLHPDRGGREHEFDKLKRAYERRDLRTLRYMHHVVFDHHRIGWRSSNVEYAKELAQIASMRLFEFKGSLEFQLLVADMRKDHDTLHKTARSILAKKRDKLLEQYAAVMIQFQKK